VKWNWGREIAAHWQDAEGSIVRTDIEVACEPGRVRRRVRGRAVYAMTTASLAQL
jgi:hypothetical protein